MMMMMIAILWLSGYGHFYMLVGGKMIVIPVDAASSIMFYVSFNAQLSKMLTYLYTCSPGVILPTRIYVCT